MKSLPVSPYLLLFISVLSVAISSILIKMSNTPTSVAGMYRLWMTVVILIPFVSLKSIKSVRLTSIEWLLLGLTGAFLGLHFLFWMESLTYTSVASSMVILTLQPFFSMLGSYFMFKEALNLQAGICMFVASLGSFVIAWGDIGISRGALFGDLLSLIGTIMAALYMLSGQKLSNKLPINLYNIVVFSVGGFVLFTYNIFQSKDMIHYAPEDWLYFVILAVIPTVFGQSIFNLLLPYLGATTVSVGIIGEPILAIIMAYLFLGEKIGVTQLVGGILTLIGMGMYFWIKRRSTASLARPSSGS